VWLRDVEFDQKPVLVYEWNNLLQVKILSRRKGNKTLGKNEYLQSIVLLLIYKVADKHVVMSRNGDQRSAWLLWELRHTYGI